MVSFTPSPTSAGKERLSLSLIVVAMAAEYNIHRPYVLATLPRPLDHAKGNIVAGEVYGQKDNAKKAKRTELVVGVDGEITSIYDVRNFL